MNAVRLLAAGIFFGAWSAGVAAGAASASFDVRIKLNARSAPGICTSKSIGDALGAVVKVVCDTRQFVSIEPTLRQPFLPPVAGINRAIFDARMAVVTGATGLTPAPQFDAASTPAEIVYEDAESSDRIERTSSWMEVTGNGTEFMRRLNVSDASGAAAPTVILIIF